MVDLPRRVGQLALVLLGRRMALSKYTPCVDWREFATELL